MNLTMILEMAVIGVPDTRWGKAVAAVVVRRAGHEDLDGPALQVWVRDRLRSSRTPERVEFVDALPYTETGKLLRRALRVEVSAAP